MAKRLTERQMDKIVELVKQGLSAAKIAKASRRGMTTINRVLRARGMKTDRGNRPNWRFVLSERQRSEATQRYLSGEPAGSISRDMGCSKWAIREAVRRSGNAIAP